MRALKLVATADLAQNNLNKFSLKRFVEFAVATTAN